VARELELAGVFLHQLLETADRHNLPERRVHSIRPGLGAKDSCGVINEHGIDPYADYCHYLTSNTRNTH
jgi:hypothetical protein